MCYNQKPPKDTYSFRSATLLSAYLWLRLTPVRVIVSIAYEVVNTDLEQLKDFTNNLVKVGAIPKLFAVDPNSTCDCVTQALWLRNLAYHHPDMGEDHLMMISESDVLIASSEIIKPLNGNFRVWLYWGETALKEGE